MGGLELLRWAEIDLGAIAANVAQLRSRLSPGTRLAAVVKANAYGHGAVEVARAALGAGAQWLCVATVREAIQLREAGIDAPVLNMGPTRGSDAGIAASSNVSCCVYDREGVELLAAAAAAQGRTVSLHLKLDTGMSRLGAPPGEGLELARLIDRTPGLSLEAVWTHLAEADDPSSARTAEQVARFLAEVDGLRRAGIEPAMLHCANSAAALLNPAAQMDMVRCGLPVYGYLSTQVPVDAISLRPVMTWKSRVVAVRRLAAGDRVGYGGASTASRPTLAATIALGYADGYPRRLSNRGRMLLGGRHVPVVGRVSMDFTTLDVTDIDPPSLGDEVVVLGAQAGAFIGADELAASLETISWEVLTTVGPRVTRVFIPASQPGGGS